MSFLASVNTINKKFAKEGGDEFLPDLRNQAKVEHPHISTGSFVVDWVTGIGGLPRGKIVELHGLQSAGKTTCALMTAAECQGAGEGVLFVDYEHSIVPSYAEALGVSLDPAYFALYQPTSMEDGFRVAEFFMQQGSCGMVICDSVAAMVPKAEVDGEIGDTQIGLQARQLSIALRQMKHLIKVSNTCFVFINQLRDVVDLTWAGQQAAKRGRQYTTPGGNALKYYADMRLEFMPTGMEKIESTTLLSGIGGKKDADKEKIVIGQKARVTAVKNKCAAPWKSAEIFLRHGRGIDSTRPCVDLAIKQQLLKVGGGGYFKVPSPFCDPAMMEQTIQGREALDAYFEASPDKLGLLFEAVWNEIKQGGI